MLKGKHGLSTMFFNNKYERSGSLFQGVFKAIHIDSNEYLLYLSAYVNGNNFIHGYDKDNDKEAKPPRGSLASEEMEVLQRAGLYQEKEQDALQERCDFGSICRFGV